MDSYRVSHAQWVSMHAASAVQLTHKRCMILTQIVRSRKDLEYRRVGSHGVMVIVIRDLRMRFRLLPMLLRYAVRCSCSARSLP